MNPELIKKINQYQLSKNTPNSVIKSFLKTCISARLYGEIEGDDLNEKIETVYNYLQDIVTKPEIKQTLNIVIADDTSSLEYVSYLNEKFDVIVHKVKDVVDPKTIDLVLFTGGEDVNPVNYSENIGKYTSINKSRDDKEIDTFYKFNNHSFMLGVCRGSQLLTVLSGGKLIQHVNGHTRDHSMILKNKMKYNITSSHHQMLYPFDMSKKSYELIAYSEYFQSNTYLNGNNEETELSKDFLEPEIVYYNKTNSLCIQGHPEWSHCEKRTSNMCLNLIDEYLKEFKNDKNTINPIYKSTITPYNYEENVEMYVEENELN